MFYIIVRIRKTELRILGRRKIFQEHVIWVF